MSAQPPRLCAALQRRPPLPGVLPRCVTAPAVEQKLHSCLMAPLLPGRRGRGAQARPAIARSGLHRSLLAPAPPARDREARHGPAQIAATGRPFAWVVGRSLGTQAGRPCTDSCLRCSATSAGQLPALRRLSMQDVMLRGASGSMASLARLPGAPAAHAGPGAGEQRRPLLHHRAHAAGPGGGGHGAHPVVHLRLPRARAPRRCACAAPPAATRLGRLPLPR
jgi:hypothetical protein